MRGARHPDDSDPVMPDPEPPFDLLGPGEDDEPTPPRDVLGALGQLLAALATVAVVALILFGVAALVNWILH
jgi:hypothetical protein